MDIILYAIIAAFVVWEAYSHFIAKNKGAHTLSNRIHALEKRYPKTRALVATVVFVLGIHLVTPWL